MIGHIGRTKDLQENLQQKSVTSVNMHSGIELKMILSLLLTIVLKTNCSEFTVKGHGTFRYTTKSDLAKKQVFANGGNGRVILAVQQEIFITGVNEKGKLLLDPTEKSSLQDPRDASKIRECAIKLADMNDYSVAQLCNEGFAYKYLTSEKIQNVKPPTSYLTEIFNDGSRVDFCDNGLWYHALVMEPHEIDLWNYRYNVKKDLLSSAEACIIGIEVLKQLELFQIADIVHRDMKPGNLMLQKGAQGITMGTRVYIIDFGYSVFEGSVKGISGGCFIFSSLNFSDTRDPVPCNDVESLIYILKYLLTDQLSWFDDACKYNEDQYRSLKSPRYERILQGKKDLVHELRDNPPSNMDKDLAIILAEILKLAQDETFEKEHYQVYMTKFQKCHNKLMNPTKA